MNILNLPLLVISYFLTPGAWLGMLVFGIIVLFSIFMLRAREKFGPGTISSFLTGRYFTPKEEVRVFLFLDLKSSTSIAEKLGPLKYHRFLNDFYREITYPILYKKGEIYQYVGDEISISWNEKDGIKNNNCIECFFEIENAVIQSMNEFLNKYDVCPEFKAGIHIGKTVAGEIGIIKREIVYSGDTLNTTSRLQELCNVLGEKLIVSGDLINKLTYNKNYIINELGEQYLRGRAASISLYSIRKQAAVSAA
jgi:adenylate cyclase